MARFVESKAGFRETEHRGSDACATGCSSASARREKPDLVSNFRLKRRNGIGCSRVMHVPGILVGCIIVLSRPYFTRQAATLLKFAKLTSNPALAASLVERAADLKAQIDSDKRPDASVAPPDVETET
jgi:hypothetical protein